MTPAKAEIAYLAEQEKTRRGAGEQCRQDEWQMLQQDDGRGRRLEKHEDKSHALHGRDEGLDDGALCSLRERMRVAPDGQHGAGMAVRPPTKPTAVWPTRRVFMCRSAVCGRSAVGSA